MNYSNRSLKEMANRQLLQKYRLVCQEGDSDRPDTWQAANRAAARMRVLESEILGRMRGRGRARPRPKPKK